MGFNRSEWMRERWKRAKTYYEWYTNTEKEPKIGIKKFLSYDNPVTRGVREVRLTFRMDYSKPNSYEFYIPQRTIQMYVLGGIDMNHLEDYVKSQVASIFKGKSYIWVKNHIDTDLTLRGIEENDLDYYSIDINKINPETPINIIEAPKSIEVVKKNKNGPKNKNTYDLTLDMFN